MFLLLEPLLRAGEGPGLCCVSRGCCCAVGCAATLASSGSAAMSSEFAGEAERVFLSSPCSVLWPSGCCCCSRGCTATHASCSTASLELARAVSNWPWKLSCSTPAASSWPLLWLMFIALVSICACRLLWSARVLCSSSFKSPQ